MRFFFDPLLRKFDLILAQSDTDAERFRSVSPHAIVENGGNMKFDQVIPELPETNELGSYIGSEMLRERAISLLEKLPAENNQFLRRWASFGVKAGNAFESQALLQLATEYCRAERCEECPVGANIIEKARRNE